jgi:hypothetical protein
MINETDLPYLNLTDEQIAENNIRAARIWRDQELKDSDWISGIPDHGQHAVYMTYRQALRDWPATDDFPDTKPILGS